MKLNQNIKAILFDLDGTLIDVNLDKFVKNYVLLLSNFVKDLVSPRKFIPRLMKVSELVENNDGTSSNENVFAENFFPLEGYTRADLEPVFDEFYIKEFNKLKKYTKIKEEAYSTVKKAFENKYKVVIATTPLLPETAIKQRLDWAGVGKFDYDLVTSFEYVSATKPNLLYFQEISRKIEVPLKQCIMVGDEDKDMVAKKLGCKTFLINNENTNLSDDTPPPDFEGSLIDFKELI